VLIKTVALTLLAIPLTLAAAAPHAEAAGTPQKVIIDTDIGDDIDDAFAVALALRSPELQILGISTDSGDTEARARIVDRILGEAARQDIPVAAGIPTPPAMGLSQLRYGNNGHFARSTHPGAVDFISEQIRRYPGEITLITIGPVPNIGALVDQDPETFRKLKRVVVMGGWIEAVKPDYGNVPALKPEPEWNIKGDIAAAQKLFRSDVPLYVMPIDSTIHLALDEVNRTILFAQATPLTDSLTLLYHLWAGAGGVTPVLFDAMTIAYMTDATLCPMQSMRIEVDDKGLTRAVSGKPNAQVCLHSDKDAFMRFYMRRLAPPQ